ncbi:hypothetical protein [Burkholderia sp. Tr-20390]|uniref:hypothetical protein n=1 Tax=Burkholderia sp. Tr-20390 TaxID=2703904 RepID=UPI00197D6580|nr:hypothetical protein [Burkholderia sp. Tr-20390]MBN3729498.1 hypothetical protein [Burkholderia sp. Tr-20390]
MAIIHVTHGLTQLIERRGRLKVNPDIGEASHIGVHGPSCEQTALSTRVLQSLHIC